ncbi:MAG: secondary thiamine-phosphate synthase enzyme YjbQ [Actinomycetota bacterium]
MHVSPLKIDSFTVTLTASHRLAFVDVTDRLIEAVERSRIEEGSVTAHCMHTTCALLLNEWEDGAHSDLLTRLDELVPSGAYYAHDDFHRRTQNLHPNEPINGRAHVIQMLLGGTSVTIPITRGAPLLGKWQRLICLELDAPKPRTIVLQTWGLSTQEHSHEPLRVAVPLEDLL